MRQTRLRALYAGTAFLSATLLFQVQPMLGKRLLPWFGGSPATWTTCMLFFQAALLGGYAYSHLLVQHCRGRAQLALGCAPFVLALGVLPLGPWPADRPLPGDAVDPLLQILSLLVRRAALPFFALATVAPLLQHWYARARGQSPYALYACSNAGSLLGLLSYPFLIEPWLAMPHQSGVWSVLLVLVALGFGACGLVALELTPALVSTDTPAATRASEHGALAGSADSFEADSAPAHLLRWAVLAAVPSAMLLAVTSHLTIDVAAVPFMWVIPLGLYLISFILVFGSERMSRRTLALPLWLFASNALALMRLLSARASFAAQLASALGSLFGCCMVCHGELSRSRPAPARASRFYLIMAAGGAAGGLLVSVIAPLCFDDLSELPITIIATYLLLLTASAGSARLQPQLRPRLQPRLIWLGLGLAVSLLTAPYWWRDRSLQLIEQRRSFYGTLRVAADADTIRLSHGRILHGMQYRAAARAGEPTLYFGPDSGVGRALRSHALSRPRRLGVLGLGVGTLAAYARPQDQLFFYELDPGIVRATERHFSFLRRSGAAVQIHIGDGRTLLEREPPQHFDILVLDAFASDSVPAHLLTVEAFRVYLRHLASDGLLIANVVNRHLDIDRVVAGSARAAGLALQLTDTPSDAGHGYARARWLCMAREQRQLDVVLTGSESAPLSGPPTQWTDEFSNLLRVLH